ncbi:MAG: S41 family peptidase [Acidobacteriota bacterium]
MTKTKMAFMALSVAVMLSLVTAAVLGQPAKQGSIYRYLSIFTEVFSLIRDNHVDNVSSDQLVEGAFNGVTDAVDEFSYYVPPALMAQYRTFVDDEENGIGLVVTKRYGFGYVIAPVAGSPAALAGIEAGDLIDQIDGKPTAKMAVWQIRKALQTEPGKTLALRIVRGGVTKRESLSVTRKSFQPPPPTPQYFGSVAYIKVPFFEKGAARQLADSLAAVEKSGKQKLIIDLRKNAGGSMDEAIEAADLLLGKGLITSVEGRRADARRWEADSAISYSGDVEILTDGSSAAGAEVFAAAISENGRGKTVGVTTFGKAVVQKFVTLPSDGGLNVTIGHYTTPKEKPILSAGLRPDIQVELIASAVKEDLNPKAPPPDVILEKALELFGEKKAMKAAA